MTWMAPLKRLLSARVDLRLTRRRRGDVDDRRYLALGDAGDARGQGAERLREVDPGQPRIPNAGWKSRLRHYTNLSRMARDVDKLLRDFAWDRMDRVYAPVLRETTAA